MRSAILSRLPRVAFRLDAAAYRVPDAGFPIDAAGFSHGGTNFRQPRASFAHAEVTFSLPAVSFRRAGRNFRHARMGFRHARVTFRHPAETSGVSAKTFRVPSRMDPVGCPRVKFLSRGGRLGDSGLHEWPFIYAGGHTARVNRALAALADPTRFRIVDFLRAGPSPVTGICEALGLSQSLVSKQLRVLREAGLVEVKRRSQLRVHALHHAAFVELGQALARFAEE